MTYVLLGFLCMRALTQYDILKALKLRVSPFYQPSLGSIQATLKKLLKEGWAYVEPVQGGRKKNLYRITDAGKAAFFQWMLSNTYDENASKLDAELSTRLFFLGLLEPDERKQAVKTVVDFLEDLLAQYRQADETYSKVSAPAGFEDVAKYQLKTLSMGIYHLSATLSWLHKLLAEMEGEV